MNPYRLLQDGEQLKLFEMPAGTLTTLTVGVPLEIGAIYETPMHSVQVTGFGVVRGQYLAVILP